MNDTIYPTLHMKNMNRSKNCRILLFVKVMYIVIVVNVCILLTRSFMLSQGEFRQENQANQKTIGLKQLQVTGGGDSTSYFIHLMWDTNNDHFQEDFQDLMKSRISHKERVCRSVKGTRFEKKLASSTCYYKYVKMRDDISISLYYSNIQIFSQVPLVSGLQSRQHKLDEESGESGRPYWAGDSQVGEQISQVKLSSHFLTKTNTSQRSIFNLNIGRVGGFDINNFNSGNQTCKLDQWLPKSAL